MRIDLKSNLLATFGMIICLAGMSTPVQAAKSRAAADHGLAYEWEPSYELKTYRQNYLLMYAHSSNPNNLPTSPNLNNQVLLPYALDTRDIKFQISLKLALADNKEFGSLWLAYTQLSFWQFYDRTNSQPFRETNYSPEVIYSFQPFESSILNFGVIHQSNGEANPRSRSWNRYYIQPGVDIIDSDGVRLLLKVRWWKRFLEASAADNNSDITDFLGYREVELRYDYKNSWRISAIGRSKSGQLDIAAPWTSWLMLDGEYEQSANVHIQYFRGYGESLLDYNQYHESWGVGLSLPF
ncbi:MAG: phospholipase A [Gallionellaceae bacterium]